MRTNLPQLIFASGTNSKPSLRIGTDADPILRLSSPARIEIHCLVEASTPHTLDAYVLNQRQGMIEDGILKPSGQAGDFDVLHALHFFPMANKVRDRVPGDEERLASKYGVWLDDA